MGNTPVFCRNITSAVNEISYEHLSECWNEKRIADLLRVCLPLIILPISLLSNCLSFLALRSRHMRGTSTAFFMLALSVLDPLVLLTKNLVYFPTFIAAYAISCKILYFLIYVLGYTNVWILVIMTADKFFAVWFPLKVSYFCTITRAKYVCLFLFIMTSIISFHHFWTIDSLVHPQDVKQHFCYYDMTRYGSIQRIWRYIDFVIWCFLPFILILTLSVLIICKLQQKRKSSHQSILLVEHGNRLNRPKTNYQNIEMRSNQKTEVIRSRHRHITLMLLAVAAVFLVLTLPNSIYFVLDSTYGFNKQPTVNDYSEWLRYRRLTILTVVMFQLSDLQHAANFFLYLLTSDKFRRSVGSICISMIQILTALVTCSSQHRTGSRQTLDRNQYDMSFRSSVSDMSNMMQSSRSTRNKQQQRKSYKKCRPFLSISTTTTTTDFS
jgi:hypothetical protein